MHILYTVLHTYPKAMARRICLTIRSFLSWQFFSLFKGDTVGRNKFDLGTGGGEEGRRRRSRGQRRLRYIIIMIDGLPFILCWRRLIPRPFPPKTMWSPRKSFYSPLPAPLMRNNDWSSTVTLSFSLHNVLREMFLQASTSCARASSPCPRLVILNRVNRLTDWLTCCLTELRLFLILHVLRCVIRIRYVLSTKKLFILPSPVTVFWLANWL